MPVPARCVWHFPWYGWSGLCPFCRNPGSWYFSLPDAPKTGSVPFSWPHLFWLFLLYAPVPFPRHLPVPARNAHPSLSSPFLLQYVFADSDRSFGLPVFRRHKKPLWLSGRFPLPLFSVRFPLYHQHTRSGNPDGPLRRILWIPGEIFP